MTRGFLHSAGIFEVSREARDELIYIDGFYFSTRYPGEDSIEIDKDDLEHCNLVGILMSTAVQDFDSL